MGVKNYSSVKQEIDLIIYLKLNKIPPYLSIENCADRGASSLSFAAFKQSGVILNYLNIVLISLYNYFYVI